jgi:hypothetical protein
VVDMLKTQLIEKFGSDYVVKNKQVKKLIDNEKVEMISCNYHETLNCYRIRLNKITKSMNAERNVSLRAKQLEDGTWWIQG